MCDDVPEALDRAPLFDAPFPGETYEDATHYNKVENFIIRWRISQESAAVPSAATVTLSRLPSMFIPTVNSSIIPVSPGAVNWT
jgi:hypothetical protein